MRRDIYALCSGIKYPSNSIIKDGYFRQWLDTKSPKEAAELARIIAELPEKEGRDDDLSELQK